jgi:hypothetical protein
MDRGNDLTIDGYQFLRFPGWLVRRESEYVARKIRHLSARPATPANRARGTPSVR